MSSSTDNSPYAQQRGPMRRLWRKNKRHFNFHHRSKSTTFPHLTEWLNISKLLDGLDEHQWITNQALRAIVQTVFLNAKEFITALCQHNELTRHQLNNVYDILKNDMIRNPYCFLPTDVASHSKPRSKSNASVRVCPFDALSIPSITNVCSYLTKNDILSFKNTSINIAIIALHEMKKYHIGVFNMNELFHHYSNFAVLKHMKTGDAIKNERYPPAMTFKKIVEIWSKHYDIAPRDMVLIHNQSAHSRPKKDAWGRNMDLMMGWDDSLDLSLRKPFVPCILGQGASKCNVITKHSDISEFKIKQMERNRFDYFLVLDKSRMSVIYDIEEDTKYNEDTNTTSGDVVYDRCTQWSCGECTFINRLSDEACGMCGNAHVVPVPYADFSVVTQKNEQQCLILLNYFNLKQQKISFCRALVVHKSYSLNDLKGYIEANMQLWLPECDEELSQLLDRMKAYNHKHNVKDSTVDLYKYVSPKDYIPTGLGRNDYFLRHCDDHNGHKVSHIESLRECVEMYVFELNPSHHLMSMDGDNYISKLRIYYDRILNESFCADPSALMDDIYKQLKWKNNEQIPDFGGDRITLSPLLTTHICSYLNNADIKSFKMVSSGTAMVCLKEMRKIKIKSIFMSNTERNNFMTLKETTVKQMMNSARIHKESQMNDVCHMWSQQYNIPKSDLLILLCKESIVFLYALQLLCGTDIEIWDPSTVFLKASYMKDMFIFLIFDKRKLFKLSPYIKDVHIHKIVLLNYFNFITQDVSYCNPLILPQNQCTLHDIEAFLVRDTCKALTGKLHRLVHKMKATNAKQNIFKFYTTSFNEHSEIQCKQIKNTGSQLLVNMLFQINEEHDFFAKNSNTHFANPQALFFHEELITFRYVSNGLCLAECMRSFKKCAEIDSVIYQSIHSNPPSEVTIRITPNMKGNAICKLISHQFNNKIPFRQIQLLVNNESKVVKGNESLIDVGLFQWNQHEAKYCVKVPKNDTKILKVTELSWTIVPMCYPKYDKMIMYDIRVYTPNNIHLRSGYETRLPMSIHHFFVPFKKKFIVKELIGYLQALCGGLYKNKSNSLLQYFGGEGNMYRDKYSFVISAYSGNTKELMENCYEYDAVMKYKVNIGRKISIFIVDNRRYKDMSDCTEAQHPVIIRFKKKQKEEKRASINEYYKYIGRPNRIWINKADLLSKVKPSAQTPPSLVMYNGFLSLINVKAHCFYNQISPPVSTKRLLKNDSNLYHAIFKKQAKANTNVNNVLLVTVT